jgi:hypothetical protein
MKRDERPATGAYHRNRLNFDASRNGDVRHAPLLAQKATLIV